MKIYQMNECEWWLANSPEEAIAAMTKDYGKAHVEEALKDGEIEPRELTDEELDRKVFCDEGAFYAHNGDPKMFQCPKCKCAPVLNKEWRWDGKDWTHDHEGDSRGLIGWVRANNIMKRSYREQLAMEKDDGIARMFATTEI